MRDRVLTPKEKALSQVTDYALEMCAKVTTSDGSDSDVKGDMAAIALSVCIAIRDICNSVLDGEDWKCQSYAEDFLKQDYTYLSRVRHVSDHVRQEYRTLCKEARKYDLCEEVISVIERAVAQHS